ncbi:MAG: hypothetical protein NVS4B9_22870 [Ktedonobacteraceae bacterium]
MQNAVTTAATGLRAIEQNLENLVKPGLTTASADPQKADSWNKGQATTQPTLTGIETLLHIPFNIGGAGGLGSQVSKVTGELADILLKAATATQSLADTLASSQDVTAVPGDSTIQALLPSQAQLDALLNDLGLEQARKTLYQIAQELNALASGLKPGA